MLPLIHMLSSYKLNQTTSQQFYALNLGGCGTIEPIKRVTVNELNELVENIARVNSKQLS
jgi:hypothetical protein